MFPLRVDMVKSSVYFEIGSAIIVRRLMTTICVIFVRSYDRRPVTDRLPTVMLTIIIFPRVCFYCGPQSPATLPDPDYSFLPFLYRHSIGGLFYHIVRPYHPDISFDRFPTNSELFTVRNVVVFAFSHHA